MIPLSFGGGSVTDKCDIEGAVDSICERTD